MRKMRNWRVKIKIEERIVFVVVRKGRDLRKRESRKRSIDWKNRCGRRKRRIAE